MKCVSCRQSIDFEDLRRSCPRRAKLFGPKACHRSDNRHSPTADPCRCGRRASEHHVAHQSKGDPCDGCGLPASAHVSRKRINSRAIIARLAERDGWKCQLCLEPLGEPSPPFPSPLSIEPDHRIPLWQSKSNELANLQLAHKRCNMRKGGGAELSPSQQARDIKAFVRNCIIAWGTDPSRCLHGLGPALATVDHLLNDLGKATEALNLVEDAVARLRTMGDAYLPHLAVCQSKLGEILYRMERSDEASSAAKAGDQILARIYRATPDGRQQTGTNKPAPPCRAPR
jgi:5-methylcytosine-specific restriction endonuclease McrA